MGVVAAYTLAKVKENSAKLAKLFSGVIALQSEGQPKWQGERGQ